MSGVEDPTDLIRPAGARRTRDGRWLGGVCAGLSPIGGLGTGGLRLLFGLAALCGGLGVIVYGACWLVLPEAEADAAGDGESAEPRGVVLVAWAAAGLVAVLLLAVLAAVATMFGLGWAVFAAAALVLAFAVSGRGRVPRDGLLVAVAALTLPAAAVAISPIRLTLQSGESVSRPATAAAVSAHVFRSGFGTELIDLRHTPLPSRGTVPLRIDAGLRRTIVALPHDRCVHVVVHYAVHPFVSQLATLVSGRSSPPFRDVVLFGRLYGATQSAPHGSVSTATPASGPTLRIDFSSLGGGLYVRDYPDAVSPDAVPEWPGFPVDVEPRPRRTAGISATLHRHQVAAWRVRHAAEVADRDRIDAQLPGPCGGS